MPSSSPVSNIQIEQAVLGALLIDADAIVDVMSLIRPADFFDPVNASIYKAMIELYEESRGFDLLSLADKLKDHGALQSAGGSAYLAELATVEPSALNAERHARLVRDKAIHRAVATAGEKISQLAANESLDATDVLDQAEQQILSVSRASSASEPETAFEIGKQAYEDYAALHAADDPRALLGVQTGFADLDAELYGLRPGAFVILAARPSLGKTSLALNIAHNVAAKQGKHVTVFSLEMNKRQILDRLLMQSMAIDGRKLCSGTLSDEEFRQLPQAIEQLNKMPLHIDDDPDTSLANLRSKARRVKMKHGLDLLIVDYLQLIDVSDRTAGENRTQQVTFLSRSLKNLAHELGCPVIALSQLSRSVEQRNPPLPVLSDLRDSGSIEQDADIVLMLYREGYYNEDSAEPHITDVYIRKHRSGATGRVSLFFDAKRMTFRTLERGASRAPAFTKQSLPDLAPA